MANPQPLRVLITGAAGQIGYSLIPLVASGQMFGPDQPVILHLLDIEQAMEGLKGVVMEIDDCAYPLVHGVVSTADPSVAFSGVDQAILLGGFPRLAGMTRADLLQKNKAIFFEQGSCLAKFASQTCKVMVIANPANTNCILAYESMKAAGGSIPPENFTCMMRLDHNRALSQLANKLSVKVAQVDNVVIWGNHSLDQFPDTSFATVEMDGKTSSVNQALTAVCDAPTWIKEEFMPTVQNRGSAVIKARGKSSACSAANAAKDHMRDWFLGTPAGKIVSMGVISTGKYGVAEGIVFSYPVRCGRGTWEIVDGLELTEEHKKQINNNQTKLLEEKATATA